MAHGLPDYYRGVDIAYQALSEMIVRPMYGAAQQLWNTKVCQANEESEVGQKTGQGMLYGGLIYLDPADSQAQGIPKLYIDDVCMATLSFDDLDKYSLNAEHSYPLYLLTKDDANFIYSVGISHGITFESEFRIAYDENDGDVVTVWCRVIYALIS